MPEIPRGFSHRMFGFGGPTILTFRPMVVPGFASFLPSAAERMLGFAALIGPRSAAAMPSGFFPPVPRFAGVVFLGGAAVLPTMTLGAGAAVLPTMVLRGGPAVEPTMVLLGAVW